MSFALYSIGFAIVIGGLVYGTYLLHVPAHWIAVLAIVLGMGILSGVKASRQKNPAGYWLRSVRGFDLNLLFHPWCSIVFQKFVEF